MFQRLSASFLLKSVIAALAAGLLISLAAGTWEAAHNLRSATRLADAADATGQIFRAMAAGRLKQSFSVRALLVDGMPDPGQVKQIAESRTIATPALQAALAVLPRIDFTERDQLVARLGDLVGKMEVLDTQAAADFQKPKAQRRPGLDRDLNATASELLSVLQRISAAVTLVTHNQDPFVDQMMLIKDAAWLVRAVGGDTSVTVNNAIVFKSRLSEDAMLKATNQIGHAAGGWQMLESIAVGLAPDSPVARAIQTAKASYFAPDFIAMRARVLAAATAGQPIDVKVAEWDAAQRLKLVTAVAETALDAAESHARAQVTAAWTDLSVRLALFVGALLLGAAGILIVSRRVIRPLHGVQAAMLRVADGDLAVEVPYRERRDEIGALAQALATFKQHAVEKARIEAEEQRRLGQAGERQKAIEGHIAEFEAGIGAALQALSNAAADMRRTSETLSGTAAQTNGQARGAAASSADASQNVQTVAAASEELSSSIGEISRQVTHAATIAKRAVAETEETDRTVQGLTEAAHRIGEIIGLITAIANQTNLLALNATIESARAGEAGKGFAVVASEVKTLAGQTAKATEDISGQIGAIQGVADSAVEAMRRIGTTIGEVSAVASSIAAAVEQQGAATHEITRNTQEAARRTRDVADNITGVTAGADATGAAASEVEASAEVLNTQAETLRRQVDDFMRKIRAA